VDPALHHNLRAVTNSIIAQQARDRTDIRDYREDTREWQKRMEDKLDKLTEAMLER
jgi:hypothetical protein